jgi:diguanylate cyclase (GGDEF)-like protein
LIAGLGEGVHSLRHRWLAATVCLALVGIACASVSFRYVHGTEIRAFLPIVATMWALAGLMTAFLLLAQFYVNGKTSFATLAGAYAFGGLLTWPYLFAFPGLFFTGVPTLADQQISVWLWTIWHAVFPVGIIAIALWDPQAARRTESRRATQRAVWHTLIASVCLAAGAAALVFVDRSALPVLVRNGHFGATFTHVIAPVITALNLAACALLLSRGRRLTTLHLWLCVAMFTSMLDCLLQCASPNRFSYGWYLGKLLTVSTASIVSVVLLSEVAGLYRRLSQMAIRDSLTGLFNRRALEEHLELFLSHARRRSSGLALLMIDVDFFKGFNDRYGHGGGDACLRSVAAVLKGTATRPLDLVARYGGEEFIVLLPETARDGAVAVAQRIIKRLEEAAIPYVGYALGHVTVSVGLGFLAGGRRAAASELLAVADRAMYAAKARGRNTYVVADCESVETLLPPLLPRTEALSGTASR